jgi:hypothetical protein
VHFTGTVRLSAEPPRPETGQPPAAEPERVTGPQDVYRLFFHGPAYRVVAAAWPDGDGVAARFAGDLPAQAGTPTLIGPRLVELCFQAAGLHETAAEGRLALPLHVGEIRLHAEPVERAGLVATLRPDGGGGYDGEVRDGDEVVLSVRGYRSVPLADGVPGEVLDPIRSGLGR